MSFLSNFRFRSKKKQGLYANSANSSQSSLARSTASSYQAQTQAQQAQASVQAQGQTQAQQQPQQHQQYQHQQQSHSQSQLKRPPPLFMNPVYVRSALTKGSFQTIVDVPKYVDRDEWLAVNLFEFYEYLLHFYYMLSDQIAMDTQCMNGGAGYDYLWVDASKQPVKLVPRTYIDYSLSWLNSKFGDQTVFPTKQGVPFPSSFQAQARGIYVQLFRIFAYIYHNHFETLVHLSVEPHWNSFFCHFISIGKTFALIDLNEVQPLMPLIQLFEQQGKVA